MCVYYRLSWRRVVRRIQYSQRISFDEHISEQQFFLLVCNKCWLNAILCVLHVNFQHFHQNSDTAAYLKLYMLCRKDP